MARVGHSDYEVKVFHISYPNIAVKVGQFYSPKLNFDQLSPQYSGTKREIFGLFTTDYQNSHKNSYEKSWYHSENSGEPTQQSC